MPVPQKLPVLGILLLFTGCADSFEPYAKVDGLRILGISANKPQVVPNDSATLSALVTQDATYAWSWCPIVQLVDSECPITHEELQQLADLLVTPSVEVPPYDLGTGDTAEFPHNIPPEFFRGICEQLSGGDIPSGINLPDCRTQYEIEISLTVTADNASVTGITKLGLLLDPDAIPNENPVFMDISAREIGASSTMLSSDQPTPMKRGVIYELELDISATSSETYFLTDAMDSEEQEQQENLVTTWFYESGEFDKSRTSFLPGSIAIDVLRTNEWIPPSTEEYPESNTKLYFVVRDSRGGTTFQERTVELVAP